MPINRESFYRERNYDQIRKEALDFLKTHPDKAFEAEEIEKAMGAQMEQEKVRLHNVLLHLAHIERVVDEKVEIVKPDGYHEIVKRYYIIKQP